MKMKYNIVKILIYLFAAIGFIEVTNLGFYLMSQPDSYLFYLGLTVILFAGIFVGVEVFKILTHLYDKINDKKEDNQE